MFLVTFFHSFQFWVKTLHKIYNFFEIFFVNGFWLFQDLKPQHLFFWHFNKYFSCFCVLFVRLRVKFQLVLECLKKKVIFNTLLLVLIFQWPNLLRVLVNLLIFLLQLFFIFRYCSFLRPSTKFILVDRFQQILKLFIFFQVNSGHVFFWLA